MTGGRHHSHSASHPRCNLQARTHACIMRATGLTLNFRHVGPSGTTQILMDAVFSTAKHHPSHVLASGLHLSAICMCTAICMHAPEGACLQWVRLFDGVQALQLHSAAVLCTYFLNFLQNWQWYSWYPVSTHRDMGPICSSRARCS